MDFVTTSAISLFLSSLICIIPGLLLKSKNYKSSFVIYSFLGNSPASEI